MFVDNALSFNGGWATPQAITVTADSSSIVDITGAGSGNAPTMIGGYPASNTSIGADWGAGEGVSVPYVYITVTTAGTTSNTLTVSLNAAPDNGSYSPGTYTQLYASTAFTGSTLVKGAVLLFPVPPRLQTTAYGEVLPRFYKLTYTCSGSLTVSVAAGMVINPPTSLTALQYQNNFVVV